MRNPFRVIKIKFSDCFYNVKWGIQKARKGYCDIDIFNFNDWFISTIPKMLTELKECAHGYAEMEYEEVDNFPIEFVEKAVQEMSDKDSFDLFEKFYRYKLVLARIAYCLEQADEDKTDIKNEYAEEFDRQVWGDKEEREKLSFKQWWNKYFVVEKTDEKGKPTLYRLETNEPDPDIKEKYFNKEKEIGEYRERMKDEAFDLMKKYIWSFWD